MTGNEALLDQVADQMAAFPIHMGRVVLEGGPRFDRLPLPLALIAQAPRMLKATVSMTRHTIRDHPKGEESLRDYRRATGVDYDQARADLQAATDRLLPLSGTSEALVREAARRLVRWVAAGRPAGGPRHELVEELFADYVEALADQFESRRNPVGDYEQAWRALLEMPS